VFKVISGIKHPDCAFPEGRLGLWGEFIRPYKPVDPFPEIT
jgi:hypothetical protein